jgi:L-arabinose isomerase
MGHRADTSPHGRTLKLFCTPQGSGLTLAHTIRTGPVTLVGFASTDGGDLKLLVAEGEAIPGDWLRLGIASSRLRFALPPEELHERWSAAGPAHDVVVLAGHVADDVCAAARTLRISTVRLS